MGTFGHGKGCGHYQQGLVCCFEGCVFALSKAKAKKYKQ